MGHEHRVGNPHLVSVGLWEMASCPKFSASPDNPTTGLALVKGGGNCFFKAQNFAQTNVSSFIHLPTVGQTSFNRHIVASYALSDSQILGILRTKQYSITKSSINLIIMQWVEFRYQSICLDYSCTEATMIKLAIRNTLNCGHQNETRFQSEAGSGCLKVSCSKVPPLPR